MSELESEAMETEFGTVAGWTEEAVRALGPEFAVPAGCRGSGSEGALRWLADALQLTDGARVLDSGAGVGGPAGWLAAERGVRPVCVEPMAAAVHASATLFGLPSVVALSQSLPLADGTFDAAWCLGVLCTMEEKAALLAELHRVLDDGAGVGGPAGWLAASRGVRPVCAEPMAAAVHASRALFGLPSVVALSQALPFADDSFDAAWCLGVLCTIPDKAAALAELRRVLVAGGRLGLLVFVAVRPLPPPLPEGNDFPSEEQLTGLLADAGLRL